MVRLHPRIERLLVLIFLAVIVAPAAGMMLLGTSSSTSENRTLSERPQLSWDMASLRAYPAQWTRYFEDHFALRRQLVRWQSEFRLRAFGVSSSESVIRGQQGWLFYADDGAMRDYADSSLLSDDELEMWRATLQDTSDWLGAQDIAYVFVISPDKHLVYPEYMPASIRRATASRIDQVVAYLSAHSTVRVLDLRPALIEAKATERIYHRTDTHWNDRGAFVGYRAIVDSLSDDVPGLADASTTEYEPREVPSPGLDLAGMLGLTDAMTEDDLVLVPRTPAIARIVEPSEPNPRLMHARIVTEGREDGPRAVVFMDSFGAGMVRFLSEHFGRAVYLWQSNMDPDVVRSERPRVVIQEWVGRRLSSRLPYNPVPAARQAVRPVVERP